MLNDPSRVRDVLAECAEIPHEADQDLAALAVAIHLEDALDLTLPAELLSHEHLVGADALARTVRRLTGEA
ncbi:MAG: hypothetical protein ACI379_12335 [Nocardioides sp.]|uniref:hypothetical protein n=1 Tax=Nocardioides sp. TaxID=35761 RepID=UPI003F1134C5